MKDITETKLKLGASSSQFPTATVLFEITLPGSIVPSFYTQQECETASFLRGVADLLMISSSIVLFLGLFSLGSKLIGLELFGVLQFAYFAISQHYSEINLYIYQLTALKMSNGLNIPLFDEENEEFSKAPFVIKHDLDMEGYFANNFNIMYIILISTILISLGLGFVLHCYNKNKRSNSHNVVANLSIQSEKITEGLKG